MIYIPLLFPHNCFSLHSWRIVIHGGIDGYSQRIVYLTANAINRASTALQCFLTAVNQHGLPHRVRSDKGGENVDVARYMLEHPQREPGKIFVFLLMFYPWDVIYTCPKQMWRI